MGPRKAVSALVFALFSLLALSVFASAASAAPLSMTFTEDRANVGKQLSDAALFAPPDTAPFEAQIDPVSGAITEGTLQVPQFATFIETPIEADVTVDFEIGTITGSFSAGAHALTLKGEAGGILTSEGKECKVSIPETLTLSTAGNSGGSSPRFGAPFTMGLTGPGAIAGQWDEMLAEPVLPEYTSFCNNVETYIGGPGGIWMEQEGVVPSPTGTGTTSSSSGGSSPPPAPVCVVPKLAGTTLARARAALQAAQCSVGKVHRPKHRKGKKLGPLVVKSSQPSAGTTLTAGSSINLKLGPKPHKTRRS